MLKQEKESSNMFSPWQGLAITGSEKIPAEQTHEQSLPRLSSLFYEYHVGASFNLQAMLTTVLFIYSKGQANLCEFILERFQLLVIRNGRIG